MLEICSIELEPNHEWPYWKPVHTVCSWSSVTTMELISWGGWRLGTAQWAEKVSSLRNPVFTHRSREGKRGEETRVGVNKSKLALCIFLLGRSLNRAGQATSLRWGAVVCPALSQAFCHCFSPLPIVNKFDSHSHRVPATLMTLSYFPQPSPNTGS